MSKTILQLVQTACYRSNQSAPETLVGNTDTFALQCLHLLYETGEELASSRCWPQLKKRYSITLESGRNAYQLPQDFYAALIGTHWDQPNSWRMNGPLGDAAWNERLYGAITTENRKAYRVFGPDTNINSGLGQFYVDPTPGAGDAGTALTFEYLSASWIQPPAWAPSTSYGASVYVSCAGNVYQKGSGTATSGTTPPTGTTGVITDGSITWTYKPATYDAAITDSDTCLMDDDLMVLGLRWRILESRGLGYEAIQARYQQDINQAVARWNAGRVINFAAGGSMSGLNPNVPEGNFGI